MPQFVTRFLSAILLATSIGVMLVLILLGYETALALMSAGKVAGYPALAVLVALPSLFALGSLPFWYVLRRMAAASKYE